LSKLLESWGFEANEYDQCVVNKVIKRKSVHLRYAEDLKISHLESSVIDVIIPNLNEIFGKNVSFTIPFGEVHEYLDMALDFLEPGKVKIIMIDYIKKLMSEIDEFTMAFQQQQHQPQIVSSPYGQRQRNSTRSSQTNFTP
jgi:predicted GTPase